MAEKYRIFLFATVFIITLGIVAIGILISYNLHRSFRKQFIQTLLYQQIFVYSFLLYGVWGRIFIERAIAGFEISQHIVEKISFFIPVLGLPFLIIGWFMTIKFFYEVQGREISKRMTISYFTFYGLLITGGIWFVNTGTFRQMDDPEHILILLFLGLNLLINLFIVIPLFILKPNKQNQDISFRKEKTIIYLIGVVFYTIGIWFIKDHFVIAAVTILFLFTVNSLIPVFTMILIKNIPIGISSDEMDFEEFCKKFEISKREAEIIQEICSGKSNQAIADALFITLQTVKDHTHRIYTKTGVKNRVHLTNLVREKIKK